ncbi:MAG: CGNR zinc finger domain-containing protein, partial [Actinoplanes sp.]
TTEPRAPGLVEVDHLASPAALLAWAREARIVDAAEATWVEQAWAAAPASGDAALTDTLTIRALIDPVLAGRDLDALSWRWAEAIARSVLRPAPQKARLQVGVEPALLIPDRLTDQLVDLVRHADRRRLRACPLDEGGCGWLFLDRSRNGSRRWCSMDDCGTQVKSRRLTERRRDARPSLLPQR